MKIYFILKGFFNLLLDKIGFISKDKKRLYEKRLHICLKCKHNKDSFCSLCGCYIYAKTKVNYKLDKNNKSIDGCPKMYW